MESRLPESNGDFADVVRQGLECLFFHAARADTSGAEPTCAEEFFGLDESRLVRLVGMSDTLNLGFQYASEPRHEMRTHYRTTDEALRGLRDIDRRFRGRITPEDHERLDSQLELLSLQHELSKMTTDTVCEMFRLLRRPRKMQ